MIFLYLKQEIKTGEFGKEEFEILKYMISMNIILIKFIYIMT